MSDDGADTGQGASLARVHGRAALRADVQGMRAVAVLAVLFNHLTGRPTGGFVGVDVFFVISGFLITGILMREVDRTGSISFRSFYRRRIRRVLPAAVVVLGVTVVAAGLLLSRGRAIAVSIDALFASVFAANWRMSAIGTDYFQFGRAPSPLQHYWSLSVEEQFYLVWPALLLGLLSIGFIRRWSQERRHAVVTVGLTVVVVASIGWGAIETASAPAAAYFSTFSRGWELGIGALVAVLAPRLPLASTLVRVILGWVGLLGIASSLFLLSSTTPFPVPGAVLPVMSAALLLLAGSGRRSPAYDRALLPITNRLAGYVGRISYSLYLWHLPVIVLLLAVFPADSKKYLVLSLAGTVVLAALSFHLIEEPIRRSAWLERRPRTSRGGRTPLAALAIVAVTIIAATMTVGLLILQPDAADTRETATEPNVGGECFGAAAMLHPTDCAESGGSDPLTPSVDQVESDTGVAFSCWRDQGLPMQSCRFGSKRPDALRVALVGDSHAAMLLPGLVDQLEGRNWALDTFLGYGCQWRTTVGSECSAEMASVQSRLLHPDHGYDLVITTAARWTNGPKPLVSVDSYVDSWSQVAALGTAVIAVDDVPAVSAEALQCVQRVDFDPARSRCQTSRLFALAITDPMPVAADRIPGAASVDLTDFFCTSAVCPAVIGNVLVYRDTSGHLTATFSRSLGPFLVQRIEDILAGRSAVCPEQQGEGRYGS